MGGFGPADGDERRERLETAKAAFEALESSDNLARYRDLLTGLTDEQRQQVAYDREVVLNLGRIYFAQGDWAGARSRLARLLADRALGDATTVVTQDGVDREVANDDFWEAQLKFIRSSLELGNDRNALRGQIERLFVLHGDTTGGTRWADEFDALRKELAGG